MERFKALLISKTDNGQSVDWTELGDDDLMEGDVTLRVTHSTLNYKDGLAVTGAAPIVRHYPMIPGIDLAGEVESSSSPEYKAGDKVLVNGWGLGETHYGGYAGKARVKSDWLVPVPEAFSCADAMAIGTAGYTAMLCVLALEAHDVTPDKGPGGGPGVLLTRISMPPKCFSVCARTSSKRLRSETSPTKART